MTISRDEILQIVESGGSVTLNGKVYNKSNITEIPSQDFIDGLNHKGKMDVCPVQFIENTQDTTVVSKEVVADKSNVTTVNIPRIEIAFPKIVVPKTLVIVTSMFFLVCVAIFTYGIIHNIRLSGKPTESQIKIVNSNNNTNTTSSSTDETSVSSPTLPKKRLEKSNKSKRTPKKNIEPEKPVNKSTVTTVVVAGDAKSTPITVLTPKESAPVKTSKSRTAAKPAPSVRQSISIVRDFSSEMGLLRELTVEFDGGKIVGTSYNVSVALKDSTDNVVPVQIVSVLKKDSQFVLTLKSLKKCPSGTLHIVIFQNAL